VLRRLYALVVGAILTGFALLLLTGAYVNDGPVVVSVTDAHGLHAGDLFVIAGWVVAMAALVLLAREPGRVPPRPDGHRIAGASQPEP
jgi:hypothetical protein